MFAASSARWSAASRRRSSSRHRQAPGRLGRLRPLPAWLERPTAPELGAIAEARRCFQQALDQGLHGSRAPMSASPWPISASGRASAWNHWFFPRQEVLDCAQSRRRARRSRPSRQLHPRRGPALWRGRRGGPPAADARAGPESARCRRARSRCRGLGVVGRARARGGGGSRRLALGATSPGMVRGVRGHRAVRGAQLRRSHRDDGPGTGGALQHSGLHCRNLCPPRPGGASRAAIGKPSSATTAASWRAACFPQGMGCIDWLLAMDPFRLAADAEHYLAGLRKAGFE